MPKELSTKFLQYAEELKKLHEKYDIKHFTLSASDGKEGVHIGAGNTRVQALLLKEAIDGLCKEIALAFKGIKDEPEHLPANEPDKETAPQEEELKGSIGPTSQFEN